MNTAQIIQAIRLMPSVERLEILEYTLRLMREELVKDSGNKATETLSLAAAAATMQDFYADGGDLTAFTDRSTIL